jgi:pilus assembly protein CpaE
MRDSISVGLEIKDEQLRAEFTQLIASHQEFSVTPASHPEFPRLLIQRYQVWGEVTGAEPASHPEFPRLLILEMDKDRHKTFAHIQWLQTTSASSEIFLTSAHIDTSVLLEAFRAGVKEFLPQPLDKEEVEHALQRFRERYEERSHARPPEPAKGGTLLSVFGSKGGVGTTTIAVNLASALLARDKRRSVVLVDVNPQGGDVALFLDLQPAHTFADIAKNLSRLDATLLMSTLSKHASGMSLLPSPTAIDELDSVTPEAAQKTLKLLQAAFDYSIIDCGHILDETTLAVLNMSSAVFLISVVTPPILHKTRRILDLFSRLELSTDHFKIIMNRYIKNSYISLKEVERILTRRPFWLIPNDYMTTMSAINTGEPLSGIARRASITKNFSRLVASFTADPHEMTHSSLFGRVLKQRKV